MGGVVFRGIEREIRDELWMMIEKLNEASDGLDALSLELEQSLLEAVVLTYPKNQLSHGKLHGVIVRWFEQLDPENEPGENLKLTQRILRTLNNYLWISPFSVADIQAALRAMTPLFKGARQPRVESSLRDIAQEVEDQSRLTHAALSLSVSDTFYENRVLLGQDSLSAKPLSTYVLDANKLQERRVSVLKFLGFLTTHPESTRAYRNLLMHAAERYHARMLLEVISIMGAVIRDLQKALTSTTLNRKDRFALQTSWYGVSTYFKPAHR